MIGQCGDWKRLFVACAMLLPSISMADTHAANDAARQCISELYTVAEDSVHVVCMESQGVTLSWECVTRFVSKGADDGQSSGWIERRVVCNHLRECIPQ